MKKEGSVCKNKKAGLRDFLYTNTKGGKWEAVVKKYEKYPEAQELKLTRYGRTALHLAVIGNLQQLGDEVK